MPKLKSTGVMRYRAFRGRIERSLATLVMHRYTALVGVRLERLMNEMERDFGYDVGCKCGYPPHKLDTFRRKLSIPFFLLDGHKIRIFHPNPLNKDCWINLFLAEQAATRDPNADDAPLRMQIFTEILQAILQKQSNMRHKLNANPETFAKLHGMASQYVTIEPLLIEEEAQ